MQAPSNKTRRLGRWFAGGVAVAAIAAQALVSASTAHAAQGTTVQRLGVDIYLVIALDGTREYPQSDLPPRAPRICPNRRPHANRSQPHRRPTGARPAGARPRRDPPMPTAANRTARPAGARPAGARPAGPRPMPTAANRTAGLAGARPPRQTWPRAPPASAFREQTSPTPRGHRRPRGALSPPSGRSTGRDTDRGGTSSRPRPAA
jgi:hypothetical protein